MKDTLMPAIKTGVQLGVIIFVATITHSALTGVLAAVQGLASEKESTQKNEA